MQPTNEAARPYIEGLVVREFSPSPATGARTRKREDFLAKHGIPVVADIDTRALVRHLRTRGVMRGVLAIGEHDATELVERHGSSPSMTGLGSGDARLHAEELSLERGRWSPVSPSDHAGRAAEPQFHVVAYDYGIKRNILRRLVQVGCRVTVVPALTSAEDVLALKPDGVFLSNGPGDPEPLDASGRSKSGN